MPVDHNRQKLDRFISKRENLFRRIQLCFDAGLAVKNDPNNQNSLENFSVRYSTMEKTVEEYEQIVQKIVEQKQIIDPELPVDYSLLDSFYDLYSHIEYCASKFLKSEIKSETSPKIYNNLCLPKIDLIKFDGEDLSIWPIFHENFKYFVHNKTELGKAEKLQYLLGCVTGKALRTCSSIEPIPENYDIVWKLLEDTYDNKKYLFGIYLDKILNYRPLLNDNSSSLHSFLEHFDTSVSALKRLKINNLDDYILAHIALNKLPQETISNFELIRNNDELSTYDEVIKFLRQRSKDTIKMDKGKSYNPTKLTSQKTFKSFHISKNSFVKTNNNCLFCSKGQHLLKDCSMFHNSPFEDKFKLIKEKNLCLNCFSSKHRVNSCPSKYSCMKCKARHHTLLHKSDACQQNCNDNAKLVSPSCSSQLDNTNDNRIMHVQANHINNFRNSDLTPIVLLSTVVVKVVDKWNHVNDVRFLLDSGSMSNLITYECIKKLGFSYSKLNLNIVGIGGTEQPLRGKTSFPIISRLNQNVRFPIEALIVENITSPLPDVQLDRNCLTSFANIPLADPNFHIPNQIDGILGAGIFSQIIGTNKRTTPLGYPTALETSLGYVVMGPTQVASRRNQNLRTLLSINPDLNSLVERMFELEEFSSSPPSNEDEICESIFCETSSRQSNGQYIVALPFKEDPSSLGNSYALATNRLVSLEKRLDRIPDLRKVYNDIFRDYLDQGHMSLVSEICSEEPSFYIPHHCVFKPESLSTPCRVVFDASMKTDTGKSLNDVLYKGPKLQNNIVSILLNFRMYPVAVTADLKQMYRQVLVIDEHRKFQRILWRFDSNHPMSVFELNTVTFGVKSSPYLSLRVIQQLCNDELQSFPMLANNVLRDMYMDDYLCSFHNTQEAISTHFQLREFFQRGGFKILKWLSNSEEFLANISDDVKLGSYKDLDTGDFKVLGLQWQAKNDSFRFRVQKPPELCTKRIVLSVLSRIFDPLGFLSPFTLTLKLLIKKFWQLGIDWDNPGSNDLKLQWNKIKSEFYLLNDIMISRHIGLTEDTPVSLIGFADASAAAYAAVVYSRTVDEFGNGRVCLLISQAKVSPMSKITLPRLELCAAVLLAKLLFHVIQVYSVKHSIAQIFALSDSTITLGWIKSPHKKLNSFVSNRIWKIQNTLPSPHWFFVPGKENIVDCASRGQHPSSFVSNVEWFSGPKWLKKDVSEWPIKSIDENDICLDQVEYVRENFVFVATPSTSPLYSLIEHFSSWPKLLRSTVYVLRFCRILPLNGGISNEDLQKAEMVLIYTVQKKHFHNEFHCIAKGQVLKSALRRLNPFIKDNLIRVGGRLKHSTYLSYEQKHPLLLPKYDPFTQLLIDHFHRKHLHTGPHLLLSILRQNYWILSARDIVRQRIWKCNLCFRLNPKPQLPIMSSLPVERITQAKAFFHTGVDYTGAFPITIGRYRGVKTQKAYICLFVCLATKALHLELVSSLSTEAFIAAFKRFISRRGSCSTIFSDRGTNFVGAKRQFDEISQFANSKEYHDAIQRELNNFNINWKFNAPTASHFGGLWESNVRSVKRHLSRVIGTQILSYEEFVTVLTQIECLLNSRPLCSLSNDPNDPVALTPAHFLCVSPLPSLPVSNVTLTQVNHVDRYKLCDALVQHYWKRWHLEYLSTLQSRQKWNTNLNPAKIGMVVVIINENVPVLQWPLAIIEKLFPGKDGIIRVAEVRTKNGSYTRPVVKLCPLPTQ